MSFLAPLWLALAGAAAVPLLIHLLRRRIGVRVEFPAARYLARAEREHSRRLRLRNLLLMVVRVLAVLCVALAAARPVARLAGAGHAPTALAIVLDNSLSTAAVVNGRPVLDRLKAAALAALADATGEDRVWLVTADGRVGGGSVATVRAMIERTEPLAGAGRLGDAVTRAASLARSAGLGGLQVAVLTDGQASTWQRSVAVGDVHVSVYSADSAPPENHAVVAATARPGHWTPRGAVATRLLGRGDSVAYRILIAGRTLARGIAPAPRDTLSSDLLVSAAPPERGWVAGSVELAPDELRGDDVRHFALWVGPAPSLAVADDAGPFVLGAVDALVQSGRATRAAGPGGSGVVSVGPADRVTRLPALLAPPADPVRLGAANRALERLGVPWRFGAPRRGETAVRSTDSSGADAGGALHARDVAASLRYVLVPSGAGASDTLAAAGREPWIVGGAGYVLVASPLDVSATTFPIRAAFVPWVAEVLTQRLASDAGAVVAAAPGGLVERLSDADALEPAGSVERIPIAEDRFAAPARPGVYFFVRGTRRAGALVVNPEPEESLLARLDRRELARRFEGQQVAVFGDVAAWHDALFTTAARRPLLLPFLIGALVALLVESLLTWSGPRASAGRALVAG